MGQQHTSVFLAFINSSNEILTIRRSHLVRNAGKWGLPGGRSEHDEYLLNTAFREFCEETGIEMSGYPIYTTHGALHVRDGNLHVIAKPWMPNPRVAADLNLLLNGNIPEGGEIDKAKWMTWTEAHSRMDIHKSLDLFVQKVPMYSFNLFDLLEDRPIL
jgi:8-oxo-dGTP pyrophosphatase MutT (NUDIX family)